MAGHPHPTSTATSGNGEDPQFQRVRYSSTHFNQSPNIISSNDSPEGYSGLANRKSPSEIDQQPPSPFIPPVIPPAPSPIPTAPGSHREPFISQALPNAAPYFSPMPTMQPEHHAYSSNAQIYMAVNPFQHGGRLSQDSLPVAQIGGHDQAFMPHDFVYPYLSRRTLLFHFFSLTFTLLFNTLPREWYLQILLRMPAYYFSRVARIFEETKMTMAEIEGMALQGMDPFTWQQQLYAQTPTGADLKSTWETFIDSLLREWKTLNIVSVLLLSAILTMLQIESAGADPITRNCALFSLICALMSLLYGCIYIIRFSSMRKTYKALEWAQEAQKTETVIWWNTWVLLAMPATWLAWSLILFVTCIMTFVWRTSTDGIGSATKLSPPAELGLRIAISSVLALGLIYLVLIFRTLRLYGDSMDKKFESELERRVKQKKELLQWYGYTGHPRSTSQSKPAYTGNPGGQTAYSHSTNYGPRATPSQPFYKATKIKVMSMRFLRPLVIRPLPSILADRSFGKEDWDRFVHEVTLAWDESMPLSKNWLRKSSRLRRPQDNVALVLELWNREHFKVHGTLGILCREYLDLFPDSPLYAIYLVDVSSGDGHPVAATDRFGPLPDGLTRIDIFQQPKLDGSRQRVGATSVFAVSYKNDHDKRSYPLRHRQPPRAPSPLATYESPPPPSGGQRTPPFGPRNTIDTREWGGAYQYPPTGYHPVDIAPELVNHYYLRSNAPLLPGPMPTVSSEAFLMQYLPTHRPLVGESSYLQYPPTGYFLPMQTAPPPIVSNYMGGPRYMQYQTIGHYPEDTYSEPINHLSPPGRPAGEPSHQHPPTGYDPVDTGHPFQRNTPPSPGRAVGEPSYQYPPTGYDSVDAALVELGTHHYSQPSASSSLSHIESHLDNRSPTPETGHTIQSDNIERSMNQIKTPSPKLNSSPLAFPSSIHPFTSHTDSPYSPPLMSPQGTSEQHRGAGSTHRPLPSPPRSRTRRKSRRSASHSPEPMAIPSLTSKGLPSIPHEDVQPYPLSQEIISSGIVGDIHDDKHRAGSVAQTTIDFGIAPSSPVPSKAPSTRNSDASDVLSHGDPPQSGHPYSRPHGITESLLLNRTPYPLQTNQHPDAFFEQEASHSQEITDSEAAKSHVDDRPSPVRNQSLFARTLPVVPSQESLSGR